MGAACFLFCFPCEFTKKESMKKGTVAKAIGHKINGTVCTSLIDHGSHQKSNIVHTQVNVTYYCMHF